jgi:hypothetical protein
MEAGLALRLCWATGRIPWACSVVQHALRVLRWNREGGRKGGVMRRGLGPPVSKPRAASCDAATGLCPGDEPPHPYSLRRAGVGFRAPFGERLHLHISTERVGGGSFLPARGAHATAEQCALVGEARRWEGL